MVALPFCFESGHPGYRLEPTASSAQTEWIVARPRLTPSVSRATETCVMLLVCAQIC